MLAATIERGAPFVFFAVMTAVQFLVVLFTYPETKGQTLEAAAAQAGGGRTRRSSSIAGSALIVLMGIFVI